MMMPEYLPSGEFLHTSVDFHICVNKILKDSGLK